MTDQRTLPTFVGEWFEKQGFKHVIFEGPTERITTFNMDHMLVFKLRERPEHDTFYKEVTGGSLIVFEVCTTGGTVRYNGYCPFLLFGIWERKLSFKADAGKLTSYRKEGFKVAQRFKMMLEERKR